MREPDPPPATLENIQKLLGAAFHQLEAIKREWALLPGPTVEQATASAQQRFDLPPGVWANIASWPGGYIVSLSPDPIQVPPAGVLMVPDGALSRTIHGTLDEAVAKLRERFS